MPIMPIEHHKRSLKMIDAAQRDEREREAAAAQTGDTRAAQLETMIRNLRALHGKLGEALVLATNIYVPGQRYEHELRAMRDDVNERIATFYRELKALP